MVELLGLTGLGLLLQAFRVTGWRSIFVFGIGVCLLLISLVGLALGAAAG